MNFHRRTYPIHNSMFSNVYFKLVFPNGDEIIFNGYLVKINAFIAVRNKILPNFTAIESFLGYYTENFEWKI